MLAFGEDTMQRKLTVNSYMLERRIDLKTRTKVDWIMAQWELDAYFRPKFRSVCLKGIEVMSFKKLRTYLKGNQT